MTADIHPDSPFSLEEAADVLLRGLVKASTLRAAVDRGELTAERLGRRIVTTPAFVEVLEKVMPRQSRGPHLYLKRRKDGEAVWYIRDGGKRESTGCGESDPAGARDALGRHIARTARPNFGSRDPAAVRIADIVALYSQDRAAKVARPKEAAARLGRILDHFGAMVADEITPSTCADYVRRRGAEQAARRELEDLRAAIRHAFKSRKLAIEIPVELPEKSQPRERWLTRSEAARLLMGALGFRLAPCCDLATRDERWAIWDRSAERNRHVARFALLGLYTATRHDFILGLGWRVHTGGGHTDLERDILYRAPARARQTKKRRRPVKIEPRLAAHLRRWSRAAVAEDRARAEAIRSGKIEAGAAVAAAGASLYIVSWDGSRLGKMRRAWDSVCRLAGLGDDVVPHVLRHTAITWKLHAGWSIWDTAGFADATAETIERVYGHHAVDFGAPKATPKKARQ